MTQGRDSRGRGLAPTVAVVVAVVVTVGGGTPIEDVERNVARRRAEHHQVALAQRGLAVATVTESTLLQAAGLETCMSPAQS